MKKRNSINEFAEKVSLRYDLIATSYHEAGHTICALLRSMYVINVKVYETKIKRIGGITNYYSYVDCASNNSMHNYYIMGEIYVNYAGLIAEKILDNKISGSDKFPSFLKNGSSEDTSNAAKLINKYQLSSPGKDRFLFKKKIIKQVFNLIKDYWDDVELISHFLIQKKKIDFKKIKYLLTTKSANKDYWKAQFKYIISINNTTYGIDTV